MGVVAAQASRQLDKVLSQYNRYAVTATEAVRLLEIPACKVTLYLDDRTCRGKGTVFTSVKETITIPKGVDNGVNLRVSKKGHFSAVGPPGDLMVQVKVKPHPYFKRDGSDIQTDLYISVSQVIE